MAGIIDTPRLTLREMRAEDSMSVKRMLSDPAALRFYHHLVSQDRFAERWIEKNMMRYREDGFGMWAVEEKESGRFVGECGLTLQTLEGREYLEVGYHLDLSARGRGFATEAARACLQYAFKTLKARKVVSIVAVDNLASRRVAERIHDRSRTGYKKNGHDVLLYFTEAGGGDA